jgi:hypothetical protein
VKDKKGAAGNRRAFFIGAYNQGFSELTKA